MKKMIFAACALGMGLALFSCKSAGNSRLVPAGEYALDTAKSSLQATVMKNEKVPVTLKFPHLEGSLSLAPLKAVVAADIDSMVTGDVARDANIKTLFFEVAVAVNKHALFELKKLSGDPSSLKEGGSLSMKGEGTLTLHGNQVALSGPLTVAKTPHGYSASFKDVWTINIKKAGLMDQLTKLSAACPQPHRVGLDVKLAGTLNFVKP